jgi:hypothetical protein
MKLADYPPQEPLSEAGLSSTNRYENSKIIWDVYKAHIGQNLQ